MKKIILNYKDAIEEINKFLKSRKKEIEVSFKDGFFVKLKKHIKSEDSLLEIHTIGYDDILPLNEGTEWLKWELLDYMVNGIIK